MRLITAKTLRRDHDIPCSTSYSLARAGLIPSYKVGPKQTGVRFIAEEVLEALRKRVEADGNAASKG